MSEGMALFITSAIGVLLVGAFFNFFMKKYSEKQDEIRRKEQKK